MKKYAVELKITNSRNDDERVEWFFCDTTSEKKAWINKKKKEQDEWNYHTAGVVSTRYYNFDEYSTSELMETDISELKGMKLRDFIEIIKSLIMD